MAIQVSVHRALSTQHLITPEQVEAPSGEGGGCRVKQDSKSLDSS